MLSMDCGRCPAGPRACEGCIITELLREEPLVDDLSEESCGYVLTPEVRSAIQVLLEVGVVSEIRILASGAAA